MAIRYPTVGGEWSDPSIWDGGSTIPSPGDDVYMNGIAVNVDQDVTVNTINNTTDEGHTEGGYIAVGGAYTIRADVYSGNHNSVPVNLFGGVLIGDAFASKTAVSLQRGAVMIGNATATASSIAVAVSNNSIFVGDAHGSDVNEFAYGVRGASSGPVVFIGRAFAGTAAPGLLIINTVTSQIDLLDCVATGSVPGAKLQGMSAVIMRSATNATVAALEITNTSEPYPIHFCGGTSSSNVSGAGTIGGDPRDYFLPIPRSRAFIA